MKAAQPPSGPIEVRDRLWDLSSDLLCVADLNGVILAVNRAWATVLGWRETDLEGADIRRFIHPEDIEATSAEIVSIVEGRPTHRFENRMRHRDGSYRPISWRSSFADGLIYAIGRDVTERLAQEERLRRSQRMDAIGQLTGGVAHDFNNLLTIIRSSIDFIQKPDTPEDRRVRYIKAISVTVDRAVKLTSQLLAFSRRQRLDPEVFDVGERIAEVSELLRQVIGDGIEITTATAGETCLVDADLCQFETALVNLAVNARDAMKGQGRISFAAERVNAYPPIRGHAGGEGDFVAISVRDTGPGIDPEMREKVFEPFFTTKKVGLGTGLGLSQVYGFVKQSGGNIDLESEPGEGAVFTIYLPQSARDAQARAASLPTKAVDRGDGLRVLIVEDNDEVGEFCLGLLTDMGYAATWSRNASEALILLTERGGEFDLVLSDVVMPGPSGIEMAEQLRQMMPRLPVILTSGYSPLLTEGRGRGFILLKKPYSPAEIQSAFNAALEQQKFDSAPK